MSPRPEAPRQRADLLITGAVIVTLDRERRILGDGALAIAADRIADVGPRAKVEPRFDAAQVIDGRRFVVTPGFVDAHVHITGDPLTRGYVPDDLDEPFEEKLGRWVLPRFLAQSEAHERVSAQLAALQMLRSGTTTFLEAGTIRYLDAVVDGLNTTGIRGRVGSWVEGRTADPHEQTRAIDAAIRTLQDEVTRYPAAAGARIAAWPILIGHSTNPDEVWKAAKVLADRSGAGISAHMSPAESDARWYREHVGRLPVEHLHHLGVLGPNVSLTHLAHLEASEADLMNRTRTNAIFCPSAALKGAFGISQRGRFPELHASGVNIAFGSDGDVPDLMQKMSLAAGIFKDARGDARVFPAHEVLTMAIAGGAQLMQLGGEIGALERGRKADFVLHDTDRPEWQPLVNVLQQLVWSADGRSVHSVWVDGVRVVDNYRSTLLDEEALYSEVRKAAAELLRRSGVPARSAWPLA